MAMNKFAAAATGLAAVGLLAGGASWAHADATTQPTAQASASASAGADQAKQGPHGPQGSDTPVTGDQKQKVIDAVTAEHEGVTITEVRQDPDGSFDALGTDADGGRVFYEVSEDLKTVSEHGGPGGEQGRAGGPQHDRQGRHGGPGGGGCDSSSGDNQEGSTGTPSGGPSAEAPTSSASSSPTAEA